MARALVGVAALFVAAGFLARWQSAERVERASVLVERSRDAAWEYVASLDQDHCRAEVLLLDARRALLLSAARWRAAGRLVFVVALVALLGAYVVRDVRLCPGLTRAMS